MQGKSLPSPANRGSIHIRFIDPDVVRTGRRNIRSSSSEPSEIRVTKPNEMLPLVPHKVRLKQNSNFLKSSGGIQCLVKEIVRNRKGDHTGVDTQWTLSGHSVDSQWTLSAHSVDTQWTLNRHSVDTQWTLSGQSVDTKSTLSGQSVDTQCTLSGHSVHTQWTLSAHSIDTQ